MGSGHHLTKDEAYAVADAIWNEISVVCNRMEVAGSARRAAAVVGDIDLVIEPRMRKHGLLSILTNRESLWRVENKALTVKTKQVKLAMLEPHRCKVELYLATKDNFGWIHALRTGPQDFTTALVNIVKPWGFEFKDGQLQRRHAESGELTPLATATEKELFDILGLEMIPPPQRSAPALKMVAGRRQQMR